MRDDLLNFLFIESQEQDRLKYVNRTEADRILRMSEDIEDLTVDSKPLSKALKSLGVDGSVDMDNGGLYVCIEDPETFRLTSALLNEPDAMNKLAELGWVANREGDVAQSNETPENIIRFIEIITAKTSDAESAESLETVIKNAQELAITPIGDNADNQSAPDKGKAAGVGKQKDGDKPAKLKEAKEVVDALLNEVYDTSACAEKKSKKGKKTSASAAFPGQAPISSGTASGAGSGRP